MGLRRAARTHKGSLLVSQRLRLGNQLARTLYRLGKLLIDRLARLDERGGIDLVHSHSGIGQLLQQFRIQICRDFIDHILHFNSRFGQHLLNFGIELYLGAAGNDISGRIDVIAF